MQFFHAGSILAHLVHVGHAIQDAPVHLVVCACLFSGSRWTEDRDSKVSANLARQHTRRNEGGASQCCTQVVITRSPTHLALLERDHERLAHGEVAEQEEDLVCRQHCQPEVLGHTSDALYRLRVYACVLVCVW